MKFVLHPLHWLQYAYANHSSLPCSFTSDWSFFMFALSFKASFNKSRKLVFVRAATSHSTWETRSHRALLVCGMSLDPSCNVASWFKKHMATNYPKRHACRLSNFKPHLHLLHNQCPYTPGAKGAHFLFSDSGIVP